MKNRRSKDFASVSNPSSIHADMHPSKNYQAEDTSKQVDPLGTTVKFMYIIYLQWIPYLWQIGKLGEETNYNFIGISVLGYSKPVNGNVSSAILKALHAYLY